MVRMKFAFYPPPRLKNGRGVLKRGSAAAAATGKNAYISESIEHRILKLKLWSLCKNSTSKVLLDFRLAN